MTPKVLYLSMVGKSPSHRGKLAGVRRYCASRGWEAVPVPRGFRCNRTLDALFRSRWGMSMSEWRRRNRG